MARKSKWFEWCKFTPETIKKAVGVARQYSDAQRAPTNTRDVLTDADVSWTFDTDEEFYAAYRPDSCASAQFGVPAAPVGLYYLHHLFDHPRTEIVVALPTIAQIEEVFEVFEEGAAASLVRQPPPPRPTVFIGHGHDTQWQEVRDHLLDQQKLDVRYFENDPHIGEYSLTAVLGTIKPCNCAILVHAAEDQLATGDAQARPNVINETGICVALMGLTRVIVLQERGCLEFTNFAGVQAIHFDRGHVSATFGSILATLNREFPGG
jgi:hypothetical protein